MTNRAPHLTAYQRAQQRWQGTGMTDTALTTFAEYQRGKGLADTTVTNRETILRTLERFTRRQLLDHDLHDLRHYLGRPATPTRPSIKPRTRRTEHTAMLAFFRFAHSEHLIEENPTTRLDPVSAPKGEPRPFTKEQIDAMLGSGAYRRTRAMILLAYYQGLRV